MAALLADALRFGSLDLRYQGFLPATNRREEKRRFCVDRLPGGARAAGRGPSPKARDSRLGAAPPTCRKYGRHPERAGRRPVLRPAAAPVRPPASSTSACAGSTRPSASWSSLALELNRERTHRPRTPRRRRRLPARRVSPAAAYGRPQPRRRRRASPHGAGPRTCSTTTGAPPPRPSWGDRFDDVREPGRQPRAGSRVPRHGRAGTRPTSSAPG